MPHYRDLSELPAVNIMSWKAPVETFDTKDVRFRCTMRMAGDPDPRLKDINLPEQKAIALLKAFDRHVCSGESVAYFEDHADRISVWCLTCGAGLGTMKVT